jgi:hypothetical protein
MSFFHGVIPHLLSIHWDYLFLRKECGKRSKQLKKQQKDSFPEGRLGDYGNCR